MSDIINFVKNLAFSESSSFTTGIKLPDGDIEAAKTAAEAARLEPARVGIQTSILCYINERDCHVGDSGRMTNESYKPDSKDAKSETSSDSDKGASITPPKHEDETVHDIDNNISTAGGEAWAANDTGRGPDGTSPRCLFFFYSDSVLLQYPARPFLVPKF